VDNYVRDVERFARHHPYLFQVTASDVRAYILTLQERRAPKIVYGTQLGLRRFYRFLVREGDIDRYPTSTMKSVRYRVDPQPIYSPAKAKRLLLACNMQTREGLRDRAMVMVLFDTGVREGELVSMGLPDWETRQVRVDGKGGVRVVPLGTASLQAVDRYARRWGITDGRLWRGRKGPVTGLLRSHSAHKASVSQGWA
jgi:site-specific recombinase XerD